MDNNLRNMLYRMDNGDQNDMRQRVAKLEREMASLLGNSGTEPNTNQGVDDNGILRTVSDNIDLQENVGTADGLEINWWLPLTLADDDVSYISVQVIKTISGVKYLYVGGRFDRIGGVKASNIARYSFATRQWYEVNGGVTGDAGGSVNEIAFDPADDTLYIGGYFKDAGGIAAADIIAKADGAGSWTTVNGGGLWGLGPPAVLEIKWSPAGVLYIGGTFDDAGGDALADHIAKDNGAGAWVNVNGGVNDTVTSIEWDDAGLLYIGGDFTNAGGVAAADYLAKDDGAGSWTSVNGGGLSINCTMLKFSPNNVLHICGNFTDLGAGLVDYFAYDNAGTWAQVGPPLNGWVYDFVWDTAGNILATGAFTDADGVAEADRIALFDGSNWKALSNAGGISGLGGVVWHVLEDPDTGSLYACGDFDTAGSIKCASIAAYVKPLADALDMIAGLFEQYQARSGTAFSRRVVDDSFVKFKPKNDNGVIDFGSAGATNWGKLFYWASATPACTPLNVGSDVDATTGALTGTTGTDGKVTVSAHTDGYIYIENRSGASRTFYVMMA